MYWSGIKPAYWADGSGLFGESSSASHVVNYGKLTIKSFTFGFTGAINTSDGNRS